MREAPSKEPSPLSDSIIRRPAPWAWPPQGVLPHPPPIPPPAVLSSGLHRELVLATNAISITRAWPGRFCFFRLVGVAAPSFREGHSSRSRELQGAVWLASNICNTRINIAKAPARLSLIRLAPVPQPIVQWERRPRKSHGHDTRLPTSPTSPTRYGSQTRAKRPSRRTKNCTRQFHHALKPAELQPIWR